MKIIVHLSDGYRTWCKLRWGEPSHVFLSEFLKDPNRCKQCEGAYNIKLLARVKL